MGDLPSTCEIWPQTPAAKWPLQNQPNHIKVYSPRAGGEYIISLKDGRFLQNECDDHCKARLTTLLVNLRYEDITCPEITSNEIEEARNVAPTSKPERANRILRYLAGKLESEEPGAQVSVDDHFGHRHWTGQDEPGKTYLELLAHSESSAHNNKGLMYLLGGLEKEGLIVAQPPFTWLANQKRPPLQITVTIPGFKRAEVLATADTSSDTVFVAMWFDSSLDGARDSIKRAIRAAGLEPCRIDEKHFSGRIDDEILSDIRQSRFVVADLTHGHCGEVDQGHCGARGSVYYEAGYAHALDLQVIFTCKKRKGDDEDIHFDIRQYNTILWKDEEDLQKRLAARIREVMDARPSRERFVGRMR